MSLPFFRARTRCVPTLLAGAAACLALPVAAQTTLSEAQAIERALGDADFTGLDGERDAARAAAQGLSRFANPDLVVSRSRLTGAGGDETEWEAGAVLPIDIAGRRAAQRSALRAEADAAEADARRRRDRRIADVRRAYANCAAAAEKARLSDGFVTQLAEAERVVTDRTEVGDTSIYDLRRLRVEARAAGSDARIAAGETEAECASLAQLTAIDGVRPTQTLAALANPRAAQPAVPTRADIAALEARVAATASNVRAAQRARIPELALGAGYRRREEGGLASSGPIVSLGISLPLFTGGQAAVREAEARARARTAELALARRTATAEVAAADARARAATAATALALDARDDAARLGAIADTAYQSGEIGVTELVDAYRAARDAEISIVELTERAVVAAIELDLARGGAAR